MDYKIKKAEVPLIFLKNPSLHKPKFWVRCMAHRYRKVGVGFPTIMYTSLLLARSTDQPKVLRCAMSPHESIALVNRYNPEKKHFGDEGYIYLERELK